MKKYLYIFVLWILFKNGSLFRYGQADSVVWSYDGRRVTVVNSICDPTPIVELKSKDIKNIFYFRPRWSAKYGYFNYINKNLGCGSSADENYDLVYENGSVVTKELKHGYYYGKEK